MNDISTKEKLMHWIRSAGGPLLLLDENSLPKWGGALDLIEVSNSEGDFGARRQYTDYDRACQVQGYLGRLPVETSEALVLDGEPMDATWLAPEAARSGMFVRWLFGEGETAVLGCVQRIPEVSFQPDGRFLATETKFL